MTPVVTLYHDSTVTITTDYVVVSGATRVLSRRVRIPLSDIVAFRYRADAAYPHGRVPQQGLSDDDVWFTRDSRRWRRKDAIEIVLNTGKAYGFTPAHATRVAEIFEKQGVSRSQ